MKSTVEILREARDLISDRDRWCQGVEALTKEGIDVDARHPKAIRWCALGAVWKLPIKHKDWEDAVRVLYAGCGSLTEFNDSHTHAEVLALFDDAIQRAEDDAS